MKYTEMNICNCVGPQNGQPLCPCQMRSVIKRNGRWIKPEQDLGPVREYSGDLLKMLNGLSEETKAALAEIDKAMVVKP